jgi:hypothetical protein
MKWAGFGALAASTMPCVGTRKGSCDCGVGFPMRECTSRIEYHGHSAPVGQ